MITSHIDITRSARYINFYYNSLFPHIMHWRNPEKNNKYNFESKHKSYNNRSDIERARGNYKHPVYRQWFGTVRTTMKDEWNRSSARGSISVIVRFCATVRNENKDMRCLTTAITYKDMHFSETKRRKNDGQRRWAKRLVRLLHSLFEIPVCSTKKAHN